MGWAVLPSCGPPSNLLYAVVAIMMWQGDSVRWETEEADTRGWDVGVGAGGWAGANLVSGFSRDIKVPHGNDR